MALKWRSRRDEAASLLLRLAFLYVTGFAMLLVLMLQATGLLGQAPVPAVAVTKEHADVLREWEQRLLHRVQGLERQMSREESCSWVLVGSKLCESKSVRVA